MNVLLTGNNGYIGTMLTRLLLEPAHRLTLEEFTGNRYIRLNHLKKLVEPAKLDKDLFWTGGK